jgi:hypothetical protein
MLAHQLLLGLAVQDLRDIGATTLAIVLLSSSNLSSSCFQDIPRKEIG